MPERDPELTAADELRNARHQLEVYEALVRAAGQAHEMLDVLLSAEDAFAAHEALKRTYQFSEHQAAAVMELQFRRVTTSDRRHISQRRDELAQRVRDLEQEVPNAP